MSSESYCSAFTYVISRKLFWRSVHTVADSSLRPLAPADSAQSGMPSCGTRRALVVACSALLRNTAELKHLFYDSQHDV
jgi:hypothetical protein